jgi:hypothetical protein
MKRNQLFKKIPDLNFILEFIQIFGLKSLDDIRQFSRKNLEQLDTLEKLKELIPRLTDYYINCKREKYLENIDLKKAITILRQILREYNYKVNSIEKFIGGKKILLYNIESIDNEYKNNNLLIIDF